MRKRFLILVALLLCTVILIATGCAGKPDAPATNQPAVSPGENAKQEQGSSTEEEGTNYVVRIVATDEEWRANNIIEAAKILTQQLAEEGSKDTVSAEYLLTDAGSFADSMALWQQEGNLPEIVARTGPDLWQFANAGYLIDVDYVVSGDVYQEKVPEHLREMGRMDGTMYGVILDAEMRMVIIYKPALIALGYTETDITKLQDDVRSGAFTLDDLQALAKQAVDSGITEYGITHRPNKGADWRGLYVTFADGEIPYRDGKVVINRKAIVDMLNFFRENVQMGLNAYNSLTDFNWDMLEGDIWPNGKSFCWIGMIAAKADMMNAGGVTAEYVDENYVGIPIPVNTKGTTPVGMSNPYFYGLTPSAESSEKMKEYCKRVLEIVLDPELQLNTSLKVAHVGITQETVDHPEYQADKWMHSNAYVMDYAFVLPASDFVMKAYNGTELHEALQAAELGAKDTSVAGIEQLTDEFIQKIVFQIGEGNYILE